MVAASDAAPAGSLRLVVLFQVECLDTLIPAGPRALLSSTTRTQFPTNHQEPVIPSDSERNRAETTAGRR
jgi:hypothetical protein